MIAAARAALNLCLSDQAGWLWRALLKVVLPLAVAFGIAMGCYLLYSLVLSEIPPDGREVPFKDVLITVLAIAGLGIAAFGAGTYKILSIAIESNVNRKIDRNLWLARVQQAVNTGWLYWHLSQITKGRPLPERRFYLRQSVIETDNAITWIHSRLDERERDVEKMLLVARNNWAFYICELDILGERQDRATSSVALDYLAFLEQGRSRFPEIASDLIDTIRKVAAQFPATTL